MMSVQTKAIIHGWTPEGVIDNIESADYIDSQFIQWCRTVKEDLLSGLTRIMQEEQGNARLTASLLLLHLGESVGTDGIISCLREEDPQFQIRILSSLSVMPLQLVEGDTSRWSRTPVPLEKEALFTALEPLLKTPTKTAPMSLEARTQFLAVGIALKLNLPQAERQVLPFLRNGPPRVRSQILIYLSRRGEDKGALDVAKELLQADTEVHSTVGCLETYCQSENPNLARRAADILVEFVQINKDRPGNDVTNHIWHALDGIMAAKHPQREQLLKEVLNGPVIDWRRDVALRHLALLEGEAGLYRLKEALTVPELCQAAAEGIADQAKGRSDPDLVDALVTATHQEQRGRVLAKLVNALVAIDADVATHLKDVMDRLKPDDAMRVYWLTNNITPSNVAERLVDAGAISLPTETQLRELENEWEKKQAAHQIMISLLGDRLAWFDTESGLVTPDYLDLITLFLDISQPVFKAENFSQTVDDASGDSTVRFIFDSREYAFTAQNFGDWYDVPSVIEGLNQALTDSGRSERFLSLYTGDQTAAIVFAPGKAFRQVAHDLRFPLEDNAGVAIQRGITYERQVFEELERQENRKRKGQQRPSWGQRVLKWLRVKIR
jgi:hypothetical protein